MSKIQKALQRFRSEGQAEDRSRPQENDDTSKFQRLTVESEQQLDCDANGVAGRQIEVCQDSLREAGLIAPDYHEQLLADQYREIKRPLIANAYGKKVVRVDDGNLIMVTSALSGEGKTFTSLNLALSISLEQDLTVLLVDADVAKPNVSNVFGISDSPGLLDFLDGKVSVGESLIISTNIRGLSVLPAGLPRPNATELLSGARMENLVSQLTKRSKNRIVIFDTPPLLETSECKVLVRLAGQVVLVVKAEHTSRFAVMESLAILNADQPVNLILNQARSASAGGQYGYGYNYRYREYTQK